MIQRVTYRDIEVLGEIHVPVTVELGPQQIPHGLPWGQIRAPNSLHITYIHTCRN
jgi:hypothetical protein